MQNHNKEGGHKGMMWMMIPCLIFFGVLFLGGDKLSKGGLWPILIGGFMVAHIWVMFKGHGGHGGHGHSNTGDKTDLSADSSAKALPCPPVAPRLAEAFGEARVGEGGASAEAEAKADDTSAKQPETKDENSKHKHGSCCH
jgi:hypothetical protein